jgi:hypothetical protein
LPVLQIYNKNSAFFIPNIVPAEIRYMTSLLENVKGPKDVITDLEFGRLAGARKEMIVTISDHISTNSSSLSIMKSGRFQNTRSCSSPGRNASHDVMQGCCIVTSLYIYNN